MCVTIQTTSCVQAQINVLRHSKLSEPTSLSPHGVGGSLVQELLHSSTERAFMLGTIKKLSARPRALRQQRARLPHALPCPQPYPMSGPREGGPKLRKTPGAQPLEISRGPPISDGRDRPGDSRGGLRRFSGVVTDGEGRCASESSRTDFRGL